MEQKNIRRFAQELSNITGQKIDEEHIHPNTTGRYFYIQAPEEGAPLLLHHYRGPFFVDIHPKDLEKIKKGEISPCDYINAANWLVGYFWGGGSMIKGGYYQPIDIVGRQDEIKRYLKILKCRGYKKSCGYMPNESCCSSCDVTNCPFSLYKSGGSWENEFEEYDPRLDLFEALSRKFEKDFSYKLRGFSCSEIKEDTILLLPNTRCDKDEEFSFEVVAPEKIIKELLMRKLIPVNWDQFAEKFNFFVYKSTTEEKIKVSEPILQEVLNEADWIVNPKARNTECECNKDDKKKRGILRRILNFFRS